MPSVHQRRQEDRALGSDHDTHKVWPFAHGRQEAVCLYQQSCLGDRLSPTAPGRGRYYDVTPGEEAALGFLVNHGQLSKDTRKPVVVMGSNTLPPDSYVEALIAHISECDFG